MAEPAVESGGGDDSGPSPTDDVEVVQTDVRETNTDPDGFFDDVDIDDSGDDVDSLFDDTEEEEDSSSDGVAETETGGFAADINAGFARAAVIGLDDEWETSNGKTRKKTDLRDEFEETFAAFRLGHYGSQVAEEYLLVEADDIHPVWGLAGAMLICAAVIVYRRPDGDQIISMGKDRFGSVDLPDIDQVTP